MDIDIKARESIKINSSRDYFNPFLQILLTACQTLGKLRQTDC